jgi:hypothetical protein
MMNKIITTPLPHQPMSPNITPTVHACSSMQCMHTARETINAIIQPTGGQVVTELNMVGWIRWQDIHDLRHVIRHALGWAWVSDVTVAPDVYHVHIEVWL